jgi:hypothetical protein
VCLVANNILAKLQTKKKEMTHMNTLNNTSIRWRCLRSSFILIVFALGCFALCPIAKAVSPAPDGGYPGGNTAEGYLALGSLTTGVYNAGIGVYSLLSLTDGSLCTGIGAGALLANTADDNTATGAGALLSNSTGGDNTANGTFALFSNTTGEDNTGMGSGALESNTMGSFNTATGLAALALNTTGSGNTATGITALLNNTIGNFNTADGFEALGGNGAGNGNTAIGRGTLSATTGDGNTALGANAGSALTTGVNNIDIGVDVTGAAGESNTIRIGANLPETPGASACHIGGIYNQMVDPATVSAMGIDATGKLGTVVSSRRFKHDIKPMDKASEAILALKPVTFHYKSDAKNTPCFGLIAEEVAGVNPELVVRNKNGEIWSVRYDQINAMLLNEFLKEHKIVEQQVREIQEQRTTIRELKKEMDTVIGHLKEQESKIQKVSDQIEMKKAGPGVVRNDP